MSIVLFRIDERLIHGQVVVGWEAEARPDRIVVVDDSLAGSAWEQELYVLGLPPTLAAEFASVDDARQRLTGWDAAAERIVLLTRDAATMRDLGRDGMLSGRDINIGGLHHAPGRRQVLPYVFLSSDEEAALRELGGSGAAVSARDLPSARRVPLQQLLDQRTA
jgi:mannose/fructose/N-acetylgalactosamine-specific phosphotransferase system component IIB